MILYHGTNVDFKQIDLLKCSPGKDFGRGFYVTDIEEQAVNMAERRCRIMGWGSPSVHRFDFDDSFLTNKFLNIKFFDGPTEEWAHFIYENRYDTGKKHGFDIVFGPIANDGVALQLGLFKDGLIDIKALAKALEYKKLNNQYCFSTEQAIKLLRML